MFEGLRRQALRWLRVPPEPQAPIGDPASVRVFRAGRNFYRLSLLRWVGGQLGAVAGLIFWLSALTGGRGGIERQVGDWAQLLWVLEALSVVAFVIQLPLTYALVRLDYEQRWYVVTDRSLRIRTGVWRVQEMTMSFANIQHVAVSQGPLQRLLGLADVKVRSAGGGGEAPSGRGEESSMHHGHFHCVDNAESVRDLILERLRRFREAGLGDPDEVVEETVGNTTGPSPVIAELRLAAGELRDEAARLGAVARAVNATKA